MEPLRPKADRKEGAALMSEAEAGFLAENFIGRLATVSLDGQPHVVPVAYRFDGTSISFGGWNLTKSLKFRNLASNPKVSLVVDEIVSTRPWRVRGVEVKGIAELVNEEGGNVYVRISPKRVSSWGLEN
ncbi:MAG: PPOX class F420-dependent oxidoreductase [Thaumarchaeota archaeon]|nr:PPOX class F420-dependent oxidoreductase [Nitrososphaerota archaeon]